MPLAKDDFGIWNVIAINLNGRAVRVDTQTYKQYVYI